MRTKNIQRQPDTLDRRVELDEVFLSSPSAETLKSAVLRATDRRTGDPVVLKYWQKMAAAVDADLRELWRHEMRQNARVRAFPRADEVVVEVLDSGECDDAFYAVMPSEITPLEHVVRFVRPDPWLRTLHGRVSGPYYGPTSGAWLKPWAQCITKVSSTDGSMLGRSTPPARRARRTSSSAASNSASWSPRSRKLR